VEFIPFRPITLKMSYMLPSTTQILLVLSIHAACFGRAKQPRVFKYIISKTQSKIRLF